MRCTSLLQKVNSKAIAKETPLPNELENLSKKGIFNEVLIEKLRDNTTNESLAFQKSDFIKLLLYLHIIAKTEDGYYFIPCALGSYNGPATEAASSSPKNFLFNYHTFNEQRRTQVVLS